MSVCKRNGEGGRYLTKLQSSLLRKSVAPSSSLVSTQDRVSETLPHQENPTSALFCCPSFWNALLLSGCYRSMLATASAIISFAPDLCLYYAHRLLAPSFEILHPVCAQLASLICGGVCTMN